MPEKDKINLTNNEDLIYIKEESSLHHYRTEIPNVIFDLNLTPQELALYCVFKRAAGDEGRCIKSRSTLLKQCKISVPTYIKAKKKLSEIHSKLGKPLILCKKRFSDCGDPDTDEIFIVNIWPENFKHFAQDGGGKKENVGSKKENGGVRSIFDGGGKKENTKEEPIKKNTIKNESFVEDANAFRLSTLLFQKIKQFKKDFKEPNLKQWAKDIDLMIRIDKRDIAEIEKIISWLPTSEFWRKNVLSGLKLRKQFDQLQLNSIPSQASANNPQEVTKNFINGKLYNGAECFKNNESIAFMRGQTHDYVKFNEKGFKDQFDNLLRKFSIK